MRSFDTIFEYNQHFVSMMNIINKAKLYPPEQGHRHHIIPKCWFKFNNLDIDNTEDNIVLLTEEDHMKVHKLAAMCIIGSNMRSAMGFAVHRLHGSFRGMKHSEETIVKLSKLRKGKTPKNLKDLHNNNKGKKRTEEQRKHIGDGRRGIHTGGECFKGMKWKVINGKRVWYKEEIDASFI